MSGEILRIAVGSRNKAKLRAAKVAIQKIFPKKTIEVYGYTVPSGVNPQPLSAQETITGAINRAKAALEQDLEAEYGIGMEGGLECIPDVKEEEHKWFDCGWMAVVQKSSGKVSVASTARVPVGPGVVKALVQEKRELCDVIDEWSGKTDVRSNEGFEGLMTNGVLPRDEAYEHGLIFAFSKFVSNEIFWN
jgi:inosine/xanthosine triphosphatase